MENGISFLLLQSVYSFAIGKAMKSDQLVTEEYWLRFDSTLQQASLEGLGSLCRTQMVHMTNQNFIL